MKVETDIIFRIAESLETFKTDVFTDNVCIFPVSTDCP
jgi:hypothetical protein